MKILNTILIALALATALSAQIVPIVEMSVGGIIGGVENGRWVKDKQVAAALKGSNRYLLIGWNGVLKGGARIGSNPVAEEPCEDFYHVKISGRTNAGVALGSAAKWNPVPRIPKLISLTDAVYVKIVGDVLRSNEIARPRVKITQAYRVDLDGDGTQEVVLAATYFKTGQVTPSAAVGDYSFVMLRKIVGGTAKNMVIAGEFTKKAVEFGAPSEFGISSIADLNGDGKMEVVMKSHYYEGGASAVYELMGDQLTEVLSTGCGV